MNNLRLDKIRLAIHRTAPWPVMKRRFHALTDAELAEAESLEKLGQRRQNILHCILAEKKSRDGRSEKMLRLKVESNL